MVYPRPIAGLLVLLLATTLTASARSSSWQSLFRGELKGHQVLLNVYVAPDGTCSGSLLLPDSADWINLDGRADGTMLLHLKRFKSGSEATVLSVLDLTLDRQGAHAHALWGMPGRSGVRIELERIASYTGSDVRWRRSEISATYPLFENLPDGTDRKLNRLIHGLLVQWAHEYGVVPGERYEGVTLSTDLSLSVSWIDSTIVSLLCSVEAQTGAPHLNHWVEGIDILLDQGVPRRLSLKDLIRTDTITLRRIAATCRERESIEGEEEESDADPSDVSSVGNDADSLADADPDDGDDGRISDLEIVKTFVLLHDGITFIWMESELEPPHYALIPYRLLASVINPNGPLARYRRAR